MMSTHIRSEDSKRQQGDRSKQTPPIELTATTPKRTVMRSTRPHRPFLLTDPTDGEHIVIATVGTPTTPY